MKELIVNNSKNKLDKIDISLLEQKLEAILPQDYKEFLIAHNGGHPEKDCYTSIDASMSSDLDKFFACYEGDSCMNILKEKLRFENRIPKDFIPIARDSGGNKICLSIRGPEYGRVYFWEFDRAVPYGEEPNFDNMYLLASNFTDFINGLYKFDIGEDNKGNKVFFYVYDKYSLFISRELKKYSNINAIKDFFLQTSSEVEDYIIEETEATKELLLWYEVKSEGKKYFRKISTDGQIEDYQA